MEKLIYIEPVTLKELESSLKDADDKTYILCGGTDLVIKLRTNGIYDGKIVDISRINELKYIKQEDDYIKIGANVTFSELADNELIRKHAACLYDVACQVGSKQIRNAARIAGNIANSSPGGDSIPALEALNARVKILNGKGEHTIKSIPEIVVGVGKNTLKKDEVITEILIPYLSENYRSAFGKYGMTSRSTVIIANISVSAVVNYDEKNNVIESASIVLGAAAPVMYHAVLAEELLKGRKVTKELAEEFSLVMQDHVRESINGIKIFECKIDAVKGLSLNIFSKLFGIDV